MIYDIAAAAVAACMNATYSQTFSFVALVAPPTTSNLTRRTTKPTALTERKRWIERKETHLTIFESMECFLFVVKRLGRMI